MAEFGEIESFRRKLFRLTKSYFARMGVKRFTIPLAWNWLVQRVVNVADFRDGLLADYNPAKNHKCW